MLSTRMPAALLFVSLVAVSACGDAPARSAADEAAPIPTPQLTAGSPASVEPSATTATPPGTASSSGTPSPLSPAALVPLAPALSALAATEAPGLLPDGNAFGSVLADGQRFEQPFTMQGSKCYTVVGVSTGTLQFDLELATVATPSLPSLVMVRGEGKGTTTVLAGKRTGCFHMVMPINGPAKVVLKATRGTGTAAVQVLVK